MDRAIGAPTLGLLISFFSLFGLEGGGEQKRITRVTKHNQNTQTSIGCIVAPAVDEDTTDEYLRISVGFSYLFVYCVHREHTEI